MKKKELFYTDRIRAFNRFYLAKLNFLDKSYLKSGFSITEARILFEIMNFPYCSAVYITNILHIDKGYLSRILKKFEKDGLISRKISDKDSRYYCINLTGKGLNITKGLIKKSNNETEKILFHLKENEIQTVISAMEIIIQNLGKDSINENSSKKRRSNKESI